MANSRFYSSVAQQTTLTGTAVPSDLTINVAATVGFPGSFPYILALDFGAANEELVLVTNAASNTLTVTRAFNGTSAGTHNPGAVVRHVVAAIDLTDSRTHEASSSGIHGVTGSVVGTTDSQTLTNKSLTRAVGSLQNISMFNTGPTGITQIVGDSTNPNASRLEIKDNEVALNTLIFFQSTGAIKSVKTSGEADNSYKMRMTDNNGTTDRWSVLAGGTLNVTPTSTTTFPALDITSPDTTNSKRAFRIAASGGTAERFTIFNDGHTLIVGQDNTQTPLKVQAPATPSADVFNVSDNAGTTTRLAVQSSGRTLANRGATVAQPGVTSGAVLVVGGSNVGYVGDLQEWVGPGNSIVGQVTETGSAIFQGSLTTQGNLTVAGIGQRQFIAKPADTARTTATITADPDLVFSLVANGVYEYEGLISFQTTDATNADLVMGMTAPAGATGFWSTFAQGGGTGSNNAGSMRTIVNNYSTTRAYDALLSPDSLGGMVKGIVTTTGTSGALSLVFARSGGSGTVTLQANSFLSVVRVA